MNMENAQERDFHRSLEPDVIINHEPSEDEDVSSIINKNSPQHYKLNQIGRNFIH